MVEQGSITVFYTYRTKKGMAVRPRIEVDLNETSLGLLPYPTGETGPERKQSATFPIPPYLVTPENSLRFRVAKDPLHPCDNVYVGSFDTIAPMSRLSLSGVRIHVPNRLSDLPLPFLYHSMIGVRTLPFLLGSTDRKVLEAAGILSSWFGVEAENATLRFRASVGLPSDFRALPTGNLVVLAAGPPYPLQFFVPLVKGPTLAMIDNPSDPYGKILLVLGRTAGEVRTAALALALGPVKIDVPVAMVNSVSLPPARHPDDAPRWIDTREPVRLDRIVLPPSLKVSGTGSIPVGFSLPSDLFFWQTPSFPLRLHYRYTTLPGESLSRLDLLLNDKYQDSRPLPPEIGDPGDHRRVMPLMLKDLTPFKNFLRLNFNFRSAIPRILSCTASRNPGLRGTVLGDSTLDLRGIPHFVQLPNLRLFPNGGYPFTRFADQSETAVILPEAPGEGDIRIFLHLMAFFGEETGTPALGLEVSDPDRLSLVSSRNLILIGTYDSNPLLLRYEKGLPQDTRKTRSLIRLKSRMEEVLRWSNPPPSHYGPEDLAAYFKEDRQPVGVMEEGVSPLAPRRVILSLSAVSEQSMTALDRVLFDPHHFSDIFGQVSVVGPHRIHSFFVPGARFSLGHLNPRAAVRFWFYSHPLGVIGALLLSSLVLAFALYRILITLAARRLRS
jgi:cellulose synthase (UDP-forming)